MMILKKSDGAVQNRAFRPGGVRQPDIEDGVVDGRLCQTETGEFTEIADSKTAEGAAGRNRKKQQDDAGKEEAIACKDQFA